MRIFISCAMLATVTVMVFGCGSGTPTKSAAQTDKVGDKPADKVADTKACAMQSGGRDVLQLTVPADTECVPKDGSLILSSQHRNVQLWLVSGAQTVDDAIGRLSEVIKGEFKNIKVTDSSDLTIAGCRPSGSKVPARKPTTAIRARPTSSYSRWAITSLSHAPTAKRVNAAAQEWMLTLLQAAK